MVSSVSGATGGSVTEDATVGSVFTTGVSLSTLRQDRGMMDRNVSINNISTHHTVTLANFLVFFFAHGVFLNNFSISKNDNDLVIFKVLEKIYVVSRELLDMVLEEESLILGEDCSIAAAIILRKAIESVFVNIKINDVFSSLYLIDDKKEKYLRITKIVNSLLQNKKKKKENNVTSPSTNEGETEFNKPVMKDSMMDLALVNLANGNSSSNIQGELHNVKLGDIEKENEKEQPLKIVEQK